MNASSESSSSGKVESYEPRDNQMGSDSSSIYNRGMPELNYAEYDKSNISAASPDGEAAFVPYFAVAQSDNDSNALEEGKKEELAVIENSPTFSSSAY